jgi:ElaB/YqjD/DUF883 family membrane-anchored ribosome-binding protein
MGGSTGSSNGGAASGGMMAAIKPEEMHKTIDKAAEAAQPIVERVVSTAHAGVDKLSGLISGASSQFATRKDQMGDTYSQLADSGREYVRTKPGTAVAIALGAGYILAKLLGSSSSRRRDY